METTSIEFGDMEFLPRTDNNEPIRTILCNRCGNSIEPNPANMCVKCLRAKVDITEGIPKQATLHFCRGCERYHHPPNEWLHCALESKEMLTLCLKKLKALNKVKLIDASFVWTEPHSKRIKVKLKVHKEITGGAVLEQKFVVEYTVSSQMCNDCHRSEAQNFWRASVQIRQKSENKKTFYYLEQLILKHKVHENALGIKPVHGGLDFFYTTEGHARRMVDFLVSVLPCKYQHSEKLISHDIHSNIYNYKFSYSVDIVPISKDSIVCLPKKLTQQLGGISPICLVYRVTNSIHLMDPVTAQIAELNATNFWRNPFGPICDPKQLVEYFVMDVEVMKKDSKKSFPGQGAISHRHVLADIWVVKASELGSCENTIHTRTHLGRILKPGDSVLGYNLEDSNVNDANFDKLDKTKVPDVILVKKHYGDKAYRKRQRMWKLKRLAEGDTAFDPDANDFNEFLDDLEEDPALRQNINIFKDNTKQMAVDMFDENYDEMGVTLEEMLDEIAISDEEMETLD